MILVTGGTGYIGSHTCVALAQADFPFMILDNLSNSSERVLDRLSDLCGASPTFIKGDVTSREQVREVFSRFPIEGVIHFAGLKSVEESLHQPLRYLKNNLLGTMNLLDVMTEAGVKKFIFSSSATVYGQCEEQPVREDFECLSEHPYGRSKIMAEQVLSEVHQSDLDWRIASLRYFNPIGAHESGLIGESNKKEVANIMPVIMKVALGQAEVFRIYGNDYPTPDGTGVRDYIHVMDLAEGHVRALEHLQRQAGSTTLNLGTGVGTTVKELLLTFERVSGRSIAFEVAERRPGDIAFSYASIERATQILKWKPNRSLEAMCRDHWNWAQKNPTGFQ